MIGERAYKYKCEGCGNEVDKDTCWCGEPMSEHGWSEHYAIEMGCTCHRSGVIIQIKDIL